MYRASLPFCFVLGLLSALWIASLPEVKKISNQSARSPAASQQLPSSFKFSHDVTQLQSQNGISHAAAYSQVAAEYEARYGAGTMAQFKKEPGFISSEILTLIDSGTSEDDDLLWELVSDPALWTASEGNISPGDKILLSPQYLDHLDLLRSKGFDPSRATSETIEEMVNFYTPEELSKYFPNIASTRSDGSPDLEEQVLQQAVAVALVAYKEEVIPKLIEADLEGLMAIDPCFATMQTDESQAADFCQEIYDFYKKTVPEKVEEVSKGTGLPVKEFQARPAVYGNCSAEIFLSFSDKKIVNAHKNPSVSLPMSTITLRKWMKPRGETDSSKTIPLHTFYEAAKQFCRSKVVLSRDPTKVNNHGKIFNMELVSFDELFLPSFKDNRNKVSDPTSGGDDISTGQ